MTEQHNKMKIWKETISLKENVKGYIINESPAMMTSPEVVSTNNSGRVVINATLQDADVRNRNKRIYPKSVLENGLNSEYTRERLATKTFYGEAGHPLKPDIQRQLYMDQSNISHIVNKVWWEGNVLKGEVEAANTARGKDFDGLVRQGCKVGFSLRAVGPITEKKGDIVIVKDPLTIFSYDWVIHPSHANAYMSHIVSESTDLYGQNSLTPLLESYNPTFEPYFEDATKYLMDSSKNLRVIAEQMEVDIFSKTAGRDILISENAKEIYIKEPNKTIVVNTEKFITDEINNYMGRFDTMSESKQYFFNTSKKQEVLSESVEEDVLSEGIIANIRQRAEEKKIIKQKMEHARKGLVNSTSSIIKAGSDMYQMLKVEIGRYPEVSRRVTKLNMVDEIRKIQSREFNADNREGFNIPIIKVNYNGLEGEERSQLIQQVNDIYLKIKKNVARRKDSFSVYRDGITTDGTTLGIFVKIDKMEEKVSECTELNCFDIEINKYDEVVLTEDNHTLLQNAMYQDYTIEALFLDESQAELVTKIVGHELTESTRHAGLYRVTKAEYDKLRKFL